MGIYVYIQLTHFVVQHKLTHIVKQLYSKTDVEKKKSANLTLARCDLGQV